MPSKRTRTRSKGAHGVVRQVGVRTSSTESHRSAQRRTQRRSYAERRQRRLSRRGLAIGLSVALVALLAAAVAGVAVFFSTSDSKLALTESNAKEALVEPEEGKAYYALCAAQLGTATRAADPATDAYLLVRIDEGARKLTFVAIPSNVTVAAAGQDGMPLYDVRAQRGDAELVRQVASLAGVDIAHFAYTNAQGLEGMVGAVGGVDMALAEEVDDPQAGIIVLAAGERKLTGAEALVFLRATNFAGGFETASLNRIDFTVALAERALSSQGFDLAAILGDLGRYVSTHYTAQGLMAMGDAQRPGHGGPHLGELRHVRLRRRRLEGAHGGGRPRRRPADRRRLGGGGEHLGGHGGGPQRLPVHWHGRRPGQDPGGGGLPGGARGQHR